MAASSSSVVSTRGARGMLRRGNSARRGNINLALATRRMRHRQQRKSAAAGGGMAISLISSQKIVKQRRVKRGINKSDMA